MPTKTQKNNTKTPEGSSVNAEKKIYEYTLEINTRPAQLKKIIENNNQGYIWGSKLLYHNKKYEKLICICNNRPVGYLVVYTSPDFIEAAGHELDFTPKENFGYIWHIVTKKGWEGRGIGTFLLKQLFERYKGRPIYSVAHEDNVRSIAIHEHNGFECIHEYVNKKYPPYGKHYFFMREDDMNAQEKTKDNLRFRYYLKKDEDKVIRKITEETGFFNEEETNIAEELARDHIEQGATKSGYSFVVAEINKKMIGYSCYGYITGTESSYDLYWIVVAKEESRKGYGKKIMKKTEERIKKIGGKNVYVETASKPQYEPTRQFYIKQNYKQIGVFPDFYAAGDAKITYCKTL